MDTTVRKYPGQINNLQIGINNLTKQVSENQRSPFEPNGGVQVNEYEVRLAEAKDSIEKRCKTRANQKYPFGYDEAIIKIIEKPSDLTSEDNLNCLVSIVTHTDSIVSVVLFQNVI